MILFSVLLSVLITLLGEGRVGLYASNVFVWLFCMIYGLSLSLSLDAGSWLRLVIVALYGLLFIHLFLFTLRYTYYGTKVLNI